MLLVLTLTAACTPVGVSRPPVPAPVPREPVVDRPAPEPQPAQPRTVELRPARSFSEVRGLWVVRFSMTSEDAVRDMVDHAEAAGINTLILQVRGRADAFYDSPFEPRAEPMRAPAPFDPLALAIEEAHARGIAVHAWVNTHLVWGPTDPPVSPDHIVNAQPDWLAVPRAIAKDLAAVDPFDPAYVEALVRYAADRPATVEGLYSSPSSREVQDRVHSIWVDLAARYDLDGIHFDYIRFPSEDFDYSLAALERFRTALLPSIPPERARALDEAARTDLFAYVDAFPDRWDEYRRAQITGLVERIYRDVKAIRPALTVSAAVIADAETAYGRRFQDWRTWLRDGILDVAVPMAYTADPTRFVDLVREAREAAGARERVWAGIGAYLNSADGTLGMIDQARAEDAGGVVIFSYDWMVGPEGGGEEAPILRRIGRSRFGR